MVIDIVSFSRTCSAVQVVVNVVLYINSPLPATTYIRGSRAVGTGRLVPFPPRFCQENKQTLSFQRPPLRV